ncbi:MAG: hypothetical protein WCF18_08940 [Chthoniobacteraceae bacterium]
MRRRCEVLAKPGELGFRALTFTTKSCRFFERGGEFVLLALEFLVRIFRPARQGSEPALRDDRRRPARHRRDNERGRTMRTVDLHPGGTVIDSETLIALRAMELEVGHGEGSTVAVAGTMPTFQRSFRKIAGLDQSAGIFCTDYNPLGMAKGTIMVVTRDSTANPNRVPP